MSNITERVDGEFALAAGASVWWGVWWTPHRFIVVVPESLHAAHGHKLKYTDHYVQKFTDKTEYRFKITNLGSEEAHIGLRWIVVW